MVLNNRAGQAHHPSTYKISCRNQLRCVFPYQGFPLKTKPFLKKTPLRRLTKSIPSVRNVFYSKYNCWLLMLRIDDFAFFWKCKKLLISFSDLTHRFLRFRYLEDISKWEDFKGLLGMTKLHCQWLVGYLWLNMWNSSWKIAVLFCFLFCA